MTIYPKHQCEGHTMKRTILSDTGMYDLDTIEAVCLAEDNTAITLTLQSGLVIPLVSGRHISPEILNSPDFYLGTFLSRALFYLQHAILHASALSAVSIDFEAILGDIYLSMQPVDEPDAGDADEDDDAVSVDLPFPTADVIRPYLLAPGFYDLGDAGEDDEPDPFGDLDPEDVMADPDADLEEFSDAAPDDADGKTTPPPAEDAKTRTR